MTAQQTPATVEGFATAKRLDARKLTQVGLRDDKQGVVFTYPPWNGVQPRSRMRYTVESPQGHWIGDGPTTPYTSLKTLEAARKRGELVVVEGESDVLTLCVQYQIPAVGIPGASRTAILETAHVKGIGRLFIVREPGKGGEQFAIGLDSRLREIGYAGEAWIVDLHGATGAKDPSELHVQDPARFRERWAEAVARAEPLADVVRTLTANDNTRESKVPLASARLVMRSLSSIEPRAVKWLWDKRIAVGEPCAMAGLPGIGKGYVAAAIGTAVSLGMPPPGDGDMDTPGDVLVLALEDDPASVLRPRYEALGANLARIHIIDGVQRGEERVQPFSLGHIDLLDAALASYPETRLIVIDPIMSMLGGTDTWRSNEVRERLDPFFDSMSARGIAVLMNMHTNKSTTQSGFFRVEGSLGGFVGRARTVLAVGTDPETGIRGVGLLKTNLGRMDIPVIEFDIDDAGVFLWKGETHATTASALFENPKSDDDKGRGEEAREAILALLRAGEKSPEEMTKALRAQGHADRTVSRERARLKQDGEIDRSGGGRFGSPLKWFITGHKTPTSPLNATQVNGVLCDLRRSMDDGEPATKPEAEAVEW